MNEKKKPLLSPAEATKKRSELAKELAKFKLSLDPGSIQHQGGLTGLRRELRSLGRVVARNRSEAKGGAAE